MSAAPKRNGLTVVVTGASSGFGKGVAQQLAEEGANVVVAARRTALLKELATGSGPNVLAVTTDISKERDVEKLLDAAVEAFGGVDVWINGAGLGIIGPFTDTPLRDANRLVETNLLGTMYGSYYALRQFQKQKRGTLISLSSFVSQVPLPYGAVYTATKFAITGLSAGLYREMKLEKYDNIHVCTVQPWVTDTPWTEHAANYSGHVIELGPVDAPENVIAAIIGLIDEPKENIDIGFKAKGAIAICQVMPGLVQKLNGQSLLAMLKAAPPAPDTSGSLHEPVAEGTGVSGDMRKRLKRKLTDTKE
ncbi:SDR family NAD(P)-dependent oxidoreductase [Planococcus salinus]|uniref:SDR family NAD(P)-dependent oxidoreductase n=1 Tax=Planococcus salinus TaxID=1848460 RepID=A0A3M8P7T4_9BACL|nr:SDR family NAD(P)-dependent oxidoreductase [Planococcus salinus]RNF39717.1 SDR family NAD(P)-dependent oxidoreductase [Planococcus salinus]